MKKVISLLLVLLMLLSLCACGTGEEPTNTNKEPSSTAGSTESGVPTTGAPEDTTPPTPAAPVCNHPYTEATCTEASVCTQCGEKGSDALNHSYNEATCDAPKTCTRCGTTEGAALGHNRVSGTCQRCGDSLGELDPLWPAVWCVVSTNGNTMTRVDFILSPDFDGGSVQITKWSTQEEGYGEFFYYDEKMYNCVGYEGFGWITMVGDEYAMTITVTTDAGATGTLSIERVDGQHFVVTAVSGTIIDQTGTAIVTVGSTMLMTDMFC